MRIEILFDEFSSLFELEKGNEFNKCVVKTQLVYLNNRYRTQGYMYENDIYEILGLMWNPYKSNTCWIYDRDGELEITITTRASSPTKIWIDIGKASV